MTQLADVFDYSQLSASALTHRRRTAFASYADENIAVKPGAPDDGAFASVAQRAFFAPGLESRRLVAVAPADYSADVRSMSTALGEACAHQSRGSVCIVDASRSNRASGQLAGRAVLGLSDVLFGHCDLGEAAVVVENNLWSISAGRRTSEVAENVPPAVFVATLEAVKNRFEHVILNLSGDAMQRDLSILAGVVDGAVLVVDASATRRHTARKVVADCRAAQVDVIGAVLTNRTFPIPGVIYRHL
jgi:Mrp family chromosome partitioning ATPase